jgi:magnesium transporter
VRGAGMAYVADRRARTRGKIRAMITSCYRQPDGRLRLDLAMEEIRDAAAEREGLLWVDLYAEGGRREGEELLSGVFRFHQLTIDDCYNTLVDPPKVDDYGDYLFMIVHNVRYETEAQRLVTAELDMYIGANYVVTLHKTPLQSVMEIRRRAENHSLVMDRGAPFLAHAIFDVVVDEFHPVVETVDDELARVQEVVLDQPDRAVLQQVMQLKRNAQRLKRSILPQRDVANRFARGEYGRLISGEALMYFRDIYDHTVRVEEMIDSVRDLSDSALNTYLSSVNNRINEVMKTLAIVTVIFLPLTLVASVYGTNFEDTFPAYGWAPGFYGMVITFVVIVVALVTWFRWRRWI